MIREKTLEIINDLQTTEDIKNHAKKLIGGFPDWIENPTRCDLFLDGIRLIWENENRFIVISIHNGNNGIETCFTFEQDKTNYHDIRKLFQNLRIQK